VQWSRGTKGEGGVRRRNRVVFEFMKIFRCNDGGRIAEEWIQTDIGGSWTAVPRVSDARLLERGVP